jgi:hypothetical protein
MIETTLCLSSKIQNLSVFIFLPTILNRFFLLQNINIKFYFLKESREWLKKIPTLFYYNTVTDRSDISTCTCVFVLRRKEPYNGVHGSLLCNCIIKRPDNNYKVKHKHTVGRKQHTCSNNEVALYCSLFDK